MISLLTLSWRNLWRNRKRTFITLSSIAFALFICILMRGFQLGSYEKMIRDTLKSTTGHIQLTSPDYRKQASLDYAISLSDSVQTFIKNDPNIDYAVSRLENICLASTGNRTKIAMVTGGDMNTEDSLIGISKNIIKGTMISNDDNAVIIGSGLATYLKVDINDTLILYGSGYHGTTAANLYPIKGIVKFPLPQMNNSVVYLPIIQAQQLFRAYDLVTTVSLNLKNIDDTETVLEHFNSQFENPELKAYNWRELNTILVQQIESDNFFGKIMIYIIYLLVGFGIFGTLLMMAMERRKENGVMNALGLKKGRLILISFLETLWISILGIFCGLLISSPLMAYFYLNPIEITGDSAKMYEDMNIEPILEFSINPAYLIDQALIVTLISIIMSIIPMYTIYKLNIPKSLKL